MPASIGLLLPIDAAERRCTLLADPDHKVAEQYGAWGEKVLYGKKSVGLIRSTFVIDPEGSVARAIRRVRVQGHSDEVLAALP